LWEDGLSQLRKLIMKNPLAAPALNDAAVGRLVDCLGTGGVLLDPQDVNAYRDPYWIPGDDTYVGSAVVLPTSTEQVQAVVRIANEFKIPLWTHSQGRNKAYGGPSPRLRGSIQLSLRKMNRVLEINDELAYAVVEPGVRFVDLYDALEAGGHQLRVSVPDLCRGSVIGNSMDNGITYMQYGADHLAPTGLEIVLPDGELLRTGMGALPGNKSWHLYKRSLGPSLDPLFTQSNFGIVTRMGVWLQPTPQAYQTLLLGVAADADLEVAVNTLRALLLDGTLRGVPSIHPAPTNGAMLLGLPFELPIGMTESDLERYGRDTGLGRWTVAVALWDDRDILACKARKVRQVWMRIPGATVHAGRVYEPHEYGEITTQTEQVHIGIATSQLEELTLDVVGHVDVSPVVPLRGTEIREVLDLANSVLARGAVMWGVDILAISARAAIPVIGLLFNRTSEATVRRNYQMAHELVRALGAHGYGEYRAHVDFMDDAAEQYSFNDHAYRRFVERMKDAVDPHGILSPGRNGIWPRPYRDR
jgi:4-cresol dehydrogenase (hydroxylating) flavoprotein subunit